MPAEELLDVLAHQPLPRTLERGDVAATVAFLATRRRRGTDRSDKIVDGGTVM